MKVLIIDIIIGIVLFGLIGLAGAALGIHLAAVEIAHHAVHTATVIQE